MLGTIMVANVFFVIIPAHWELIHAKQAGREPDPAAGARGKQRSVHNNYLTLPVLFAMLSNHFAFTYTHARQLGRPRVPDGDRRGDPPLLQPAPPGPQRLGDPASRRRSRSRESPSGSGRRRRRAPGRRCRSRKFAASSTSVAASATRCIRRSPASRRRRRGSRFDTPEQIAAQGVGDRAAGRRPEGDAARKRDAHDPGGARCTRRVDQSGCEHPLMLHITAGGLDFVARLEEEAAPQTVAAFRTLLPLESRIIHVRWSGEGGWIPWGDLDLGLGPENATRYPSPGRADHLPGRRQRGRAAARVWLRRVREQGRRARGQPFRHDRRGQRAAARARPAHALGRRAGNRLHRALTAGSLSPIVRGSLRLLLALAAAFLVALVPAASAAVSPLMIAAGGHNSCVVTGSGGIQCWGQVYGLKPVDVTGLSGGASKIAVGWAHASRSPTREASSAGAAISSARSATEPVPAARRRSTSRA